MTSKLALFDQTLIASLLQPLSVNQLDFKAYKTNIKLKITEQRSETTGEKELNFEISRSDDYEFLFAETLNNEKYQTLAREHDLTVDFDAFPKVIIQHLLCKNIVNNSNENEEVDARKKPGYHSIIDAGKPTEINIILDAEKNFCSFELFSKTPISKGRIFSMKLMAVRGDKLITHLLKICSRQSIKLASFHKTTDEMAHLKNKLTNLEKECEKLTDSQEKLEELSEKYKELEDELELVKEEKENVLILAEERENLVAELQNDADSLNQRLEENKEELEIVGKMLREEQNKVDQLQKRNVLHQKEIGKLRAEMASLQRNMEKADTLLKKNDQQQNQQSLDIRKLRELEADLKEKDSMVESLTDTIGLLRKELENEKLKMSETMESFEKMRVENETNKEKLAHYRIQRYSPAPNGLTPLGLGFQGRQTPFKTVLGPNSPYSNPNLRTPFRENTVNFQNSTIPTPHATVRFNGQLVADETTGSSVTNTPPVIRRND